MRNFFCLVLLIVLSACGAKEPAPEAPKAPRDVAYEVYKDGTKLGVIAIKAGSVGDFTPTDAPGAALFQSIWKEETARGHVSIRMHMPTEDGSRGGYGLQMYKPTEGSYAEGVSYFLMDQNYTGVEIPYVEKVASKPAPEEPAREVTYEVYKAGTKLGVIYIKPGDFGVLTPEANAEGEALRLLWEESKGKGELRIKMHMPSKDGSRGGLGARTYKPEENSFAAGVNFFLLDKGYAVKELPASQPATSQATSQKTP